jgi:tetratricopeptide (TPR) repeat protein
VLRDEGEFIEAIKELDIAVKLDPTSVSYLEERASLEDKIGLYERSINDYSKSIELDPKKDINYLLRSIAKTSLGDYENAIKDCESAVTINPNSELAFIQIGFNYDELGKFEKAIEHYNKSIQIDNGSAIAYTNRAFTFIQIGKYDLAKQDCDSAMKKFDPKFKYAGYNNRGVAKYYLEQYDSAVRDFGRSLSIDPSNIYACLWRGKTFLKTFNRENLAVKDFRKVIQSSDSALKINSRDAFKLYYKGQALAELGKINEASVNYKKAIALRKDNYLFNKALNELEEKRKAKK